MPALNPSSDWVLVQILIRGGVMGCCSCLQFDGSVRFDEISIVNEALRWLCYGDEGGGCDFEINLCMGGLVIRMRSQFGRGMLSVGRIFGVGGM